MNIIRKLINKLDDIVANDVNEAYIASSFKYSIELKSDSDKCMYNVSYTETKLPKQIAIISKKAWFYPESEFEKIILKKHEVLFIDECKKQLRKSRKDSELEIKNGVRRTGKHIVSADVDIFSIKYKKIKYTEYEKLPKCIKQ